jgi:CRISPR system Cascade subunit CasE
LRASIGANEAFATSRRSEPTLGDAILDRIVHNAYRLELDGPSMRKIFKLAGTIAVESSTHIDIERRRGRAAGISVLDLKGIIEVTDPAGFVDKLGRGFGSAKAFGNGLMLVRRA